MDGWVRYDRNTDVGTDEDCLDSEGLKSYHSYADRDTRPVMLTETSDDVVEKTVTVPRLSPVFPVNTQ